ncbi:MAG: hypothetical protein KGK01_01025 [Bradyrhizobium sp.]|uniref:hypothetical protein n=1 Tax=Bradyrhizobium sp. TaxID=376 RepID=UPI001C28A29A|nr:hypothetical protein [Bradyrhizobium sp.]MBU6461766.1 hypothetical protein [Pseudomonadota bacterium]MDE2068013.1 hypothetical protein [Bradyrhizobium sp.]MDE2241052.1 hypothetical protein [Bradyrhizobium sp.]MDE2469668.1 hypothetical protein [Bradyrhizobium sp.]
MRKFILITAMVLVSATAQAGGSRGLTLASNDGSTAGNAKPTKAQRSETPKYVEKPAVADSGTEQPTDQRPAPVQQDAPKTAKTFKPQRRRESVVEARVIYELHRHGIYW